ncbi:hypothetical protein DFH09DRAFT_1338391 [Mycena vulgaris]|nr:hypothetical protein DFH09DRAFT_1338391 [Mycena vulgaris]
MGNGGGQAKGLNTPGANMKMVGSLEKQGRQKKSHQSGTQAKRASIVQRQRQAIPERNDLDDPEVGSFSGFKHQAKGLPPAPRPSLPHSSFHTSRALHTHPVDDFFRHVHTSRKQDSRDVPPPYDDLPEYPTTATEPVTLAMYLFRFGFLFPPFWIMGVIILLCLCAPTPADTPGAWLPEKPAAERMLILERMPTVELKLARRCFYAFLGLLLLIIATAVGLTFWFGTP